MDVVTLDAMIQRTDFSIGPIEAVATEQIQTLSVESLSSQSMIVPMLRKPDFQRETNQWTPKQLSTFLKSYLDLELIPSVILWRSPSYVFVIDGAHRLSALRAWIEDDYGDGPISRKYYEQEISEDQRRVAERVRRQIEADIGKYRDIKSALVDPDAYDPKMVKRARNMATRSLSLQWVVGDAEKAESSFFKINTQGTALDKTEELLLKNRKRPVAIAARSILRAGTGNKYWSRFEDNLAEEIVEQSRKIHELIFKPYLEHPIRTLQLPLGGGASPLLALDLLLKFATVSNATQAEPYPKFEAFPEDQDGTATRDVLKNCYKVASWMTGNEACSLGLHPAVYFYNDQGRHSADMFLAFASLVARKLAVNNKLFFQNFSENRRSIEDFLLRIKPSLPLLINAVTSSGRVAKLSTFLDELVTRAKSRQELDITWAIEQISPNSRNRNILERPEPATENFSKETKSAIYLRESLQSAVRCAICDGLLEPVISVSYDHDRPIRDGGRGTVENGKLTHPYCNTGVKG